MPNNRDDQKIGSQSSLGDTSGPEFESPGKNPSSGKISQGKQGGDSGKGTGSKKNIDDDDMSTAGGREGNFSDKDRRGDEQWSPGSSGGSSDQ